MRGIEQIKTAADECVVRAEDESRECRDRLEAELTQSKRRADHAEKWLMLIRQEIEGASCPRSGQFRTDGRRDVTD